MTKGKITRLVKITYSSRSSNALGKKLFGYKSWNVKSGKKAYVHKPIEGSLQGLPVIRVGRSRFIAPEEKLNEIEDEIERNGGFVRRVDPVTADEKQAERNALKVYTGFIDPLIEKIKYASGAQSKAIYVSSLENAMRMVNYFEKFLNELDDYGSSFVDEEAQRDRDLVKRMQALKSIANEDFEAAKMQTELFAVDLENLRDQILR